MQYETTASAGAAGRNAGSSHGATVAAGGGRVSVTSSMDLDYGGVVATLFAHQLPHPEDLEDFARDDEYVRDLVTEGVRFFGELEIEQTRGELAAMEPGDAWRGWRELCESRAAEVFPGLADTADDSAGREQAMESEPPVRHAADEDDDEDVWC